MKSHSEDLIKHIAVSVAIPEIFYDFRIYNKLKIYVKTENELDEELENIKYKKYKLKNYDVDSWHFERIVKIYKEFSLNGHLKTNLNVILERLENNHFEKAEELAKKVYDLILQEKIFFSEIYDEEEYLSLDLERFLKGDMFEWKTFNECVSIVTIALDNLLTTYLISPPSRKIKLNIINLEKTIERLNLNENEIEKFKEELKDNLIYYSNKTSLNLSKKRGKTSSEFNFNSNLNEKFNWDLLKSEIKIDGLRNEIEISLKEKEQIEIVEQSEIIEEKQEINPELDYYFSRPKKNIEIIEEEDMAPIIKGMKGTKEMCPVCFSSNISYISGCMCCNDCGWSACSLS